MKISPIFDKRLRLEKCRNCRKLVPNYQIEIWSHCCQDCVAQDLQSFSKGLEEVDDRE